MARVCLFRCLGDLGAILSDFGKEFYATLYLSASALRRQPMYLLTQVNIKHADYYKEYD